MKKIIGIIGITGLAFGIILGLEDNGRLKSEMDLASIISLNIANAENGNTLYLENCRSTNSYDNSCTSGTLTRYKCRPEQGVNNSCVVYS